MSKLFMKYISCYLVLAIFVMGIVPRVYAGFSPSEVVALSQFDRSADLAKIQKILEMKLIKERLDNLGFSHDEIQSRLGLLSDQQIHQLALQLDELEVGGESATAIIIIVLLVVAVGFLLYLYLTRSRVVITK
jgi:hypothetical protein